MSISDSIKKNNVLEVANEPYDNRVNFYQCNFVFSNDNSNTYTNRIHYALSSDNAYSIGIGNSNSNSKGKYQKQKE